MQCCKNDVQHRGSGCHHCLKNGGRATAYAAQIRFKEKGVIVHTGRQIFMRKALAREWPKRRGRSCGVPVQHECCAKSTVRRDHIRDMRGHLRNLFTASSRQDIAAPVFASEEKLGKPLPCSKKKPRTGGGDGEVEEAVSVCGLAHAWRGSGQPGQLLRAVTTHVACMKKAGTRSRLLLAALDAVDGVG